MLHHYSLNNQKRHQKRRHKRRSDHGTARQLLPPIGFALLPLVAQLAVNMLFQGIRLAEVVQLDLRMYMGCKVFGVGGGEGGVLWIVRYDCLGGEDERLKD